MKLSEIPSSETAPDLTRRGLKIVANLSINHLTRNDRDLLDGLTRAKYQDLIGEFDYGYIVETVPGPPDGDSAHLQKLGFSDTYIKIITDLFAHGIYFVCFEMDGTILDDYPLFYEEPVGQTADRA